MHRRSSKSYSSRNSKIPERSKIPDCVIASNKSAEYNYFLDKTFEAGLVLLGSEVKSVRQQKISLSEAYIYEDNSEIWLANLYIPEHKTGGWTNHNPRRLRKLLLHKYQIARLRKDLLIPGITLVPIKFYFRNGRAKLLIALARGKKLIDKREVIKEREATLEANRALKHRLRRPRAQRNTQRSVTPRRTRENKNVRGSKARSARRNVRHDN